MEKSKQGGGITPKFNDKNEDSLAPTKYEGNKQDKKLEKVEKLNDKELSDRLDNYANIGGKVEDYFAIQKIHEKYKSEVKEMEIKWGKQDAHYAQGLRMGLPHLPYEMLQDSRVQEIQMKRDYILKKAKVVYNKNNSLTKYFQEQKLSNKYFQKKYNDKGKDKGTDREK